MKIFRCPSCEQVVYFENTQCTHCGTALGFLPDQLLLSGLTPADAGRWRHRRKGDCAGCARTFHGNRCATG